MEDKPEVEISPSGRGGRRPGSGRKPRGSDEDAKADARARNSPYKEVQKQKAITERYRAKMAELEYREKVGQLVDRIDVRNTWAEHILTVKGRLLTLPVRVSPLIQGEKDQRLIQEAILKELHSILGELAGESPDSADGTSGDDPQLGPAAETDGSAVG